jgi:hypothetical protein
MQVSETRRSRDRSTQMPVGGSSIVAGGIGF